MEIAIANIDIYACTMDSFTDAIANSHDFTFFSSDSVANSTELL
jgi:hypothetical protein